MTIDLTMVGGIYFITYAEDNRYLKIGKAKVFAQRFRGYITHSPYTLDVQLLLPSSKRTFDTPPNRYVER
jgi:hypothetical protein